MAPLNHALGHTLGGLPVVIAVGLAVTLAAGPRLAGAQDAPSDAEAEGGAECAIGVEAVVEAVGGGLSVRDDCLPAASADGARIAIADAQTDPATGRTSRYAVRIVVVATGRADRPREVIGRRTRGIEAANRAAEQINQLLAQGRFRPVASVEGSGNEWRVGSATIRLALDARRTDRGLIQWVLDGRTAAEVAVTGSAATRAGRALRGAAATPACSALAPKILEVRAPSSASFAIVLTGSESPASPQCAPAAMHWQLVGLGGRRRR